MSSTGDCKIYVGNLAFELETPDLIEVFKHLGEIVDAVVIKDKVSGHSRGFGFVTFRDEACAKAALEMQGFALSGRQLRIKLALSREAMNAPN